jgi:acetone carboxylase gamma subunit
MVRILEYLETVEADGHRVYRCLKCGEVLGPSERDYKDYAMKRIVSPSKNQPAYLAPKSDYFVMKEYYCPKCAVMFEVDFVAKDEPQIHSIQLKE